jgi:hypothetical protein
MNTNSTNSTNFYQLAKVNNVSNENNKQYHQQKFIPKKQIQDIDSDEENDSDNDNNETFNDNNEEFTDFKKNVKEWLTLDDDINTLQNAIKERKTKKNEITPKVIDFMNRFEINDLNTQNGKLKFTKTLQTKPLNKQFLVSRLGDFFKDFGKGEKAATFILENRDKQERLNLRRVKEKKTEFKL